ncbi:M15 family metallopeptidase [Blastococcus saxobsidens]|nr:M15 family metallopeptidase [Blastococcus saxobsidens]
MCSLGSAGHVLRCDAAAAYRAMSAAYAAALGAPICITDSYRTYAGQVRLYGQKPALAAVPGTSNHGWGLAVDLCGGIQAFGTPQYAWMVANAGSDSCTPRGLIPAPAARSPGTGSTRAAESGPGAGGRGGIVGASS